MSTLKSLPHQVIIDADTIAKESAGNVKPAISSCWEQLSPFIEIPFEYLKRKQHPCHLQPQIVRKPRHELAQNYK